MANFQSYLDQLKQSIGNVSAQNLFDSQNKYRLIDVRESDETASGMIPNAIHISRGTLETNIETVVVDKNQPVLLYCAAGTRSLLAAASLKAIGYKTVLSLDGGIKGWKDAGYPLQAGQSAKSRLEATRYSSQIRLKEIGENGQELLRKARVLIVGAGGLGSPTSYYLAAAGVGTIGIVDDDKVELSNLQRQILHNSDRIGLSKVDSARLTLNALNPNIKIVPHAVRLDRTNIDSILPDYDLIVDGTDNFQTRYLINDACLKFGKINVHGSIFWFEGQVSTFCSPSGPCYRCLYPEPPPKELSPSCNEAGVLGVLPGLVGVLQATEVLKHILKIGDSLVGQLAMIDTLEMNWRKVRVRKNPNCQSCNDPQSIVYQDYNEFCNRSI